jgi:hypothetical protein
MPSYPSSDPQTALTAHLDSFFTGHTSAWRTWPFGPIYQRVPGFRVFVASPGPRLAAWTYITSGCWQATEQDGHGLEFILTANQDLDRCVELLAVSAFYHAGPPSQRLDHGHTVNFGQPWLPGSTLDHALVSLPYSYGPDLEICAWDRGHARLLSLLPISRAERDFRHDHGLEALEQRFEQAQVDYTNPQRASVI